MPEIGRFIGIMIRMFAEPAAPHHRPHLHAYYQDVVGIFVIRLNCLPPGTGCKQVGHLARSSPFDRR